MQPRDDVDMGIVTVVAARDPVRMQVSLAGVGSDEAVHNRMVVIVCLGNQSRELLEVRDSSAWKLVAAYPFDPILALQFLFYIVQGEPCWCVQSPRSIR